jgi:hypothetical protein
VCVRGIDCRSRVEKGQAAWQGPRLHRRVQRGATIIIRSPWVETAGEKRRNSCRIAIEAGMVQIGSTVAIDSRPVLPLWSFLHSSRTVI